MCSGADTDTLYIAIPKDACHVSYSYYCVISDSEGRELSRSCEAAMRVSHNIQWIDCKDGKHHMRGCVGEDCTEREKGSEEEHRFEPETTLVYATAAETGLAARLCRLCGAFAETRVLPKLTGHSTHTYRWEPFETKDYNTGSAEIESPGHIYRCSCGDSPVGLRPHDFGEWEIIEPATEKKTGLKTRTCLVCGWEDLVVIEKKFHRHTAALNYDEIDIKESDDFRKLKSDAKRHWQICTDPECGQATDYEMHRWSDWQFVQFLTDDQVGEVQRYCTVCGWYESRFVTPGIDADPVIGKNVKATLKRSGASGLVTMEAKPPVGYEFLYWVNNSNNDGVDHYHIRELENGARPTEPKMTFHVGPDHNRNYDENGRQTTINPVLIEAKCVRKDNEIIFYSGGGKTEYARLWPGQKLFADGKVLDTDRTDYVAYYASQTQSEDRDDDRVATLLLKNYSYGPIEMNDTGLPCEFHIIVEGDSRIDLGATDGVKDGILGSAGGGSIHISSENGSGLSMFLSGSEGELCGIRTRANDTREETDLILEGNVRLKMELGQEGGSDDPDGASVIGINCPGYVTVKDDADIEMTLYSLDDRNLCRTPMQGIKTKHEMQINTTGRIRIDAYDVADGFRAAGINAPEITVSKIGQLQICVPKGKSKAVSASISYDRQEYVFVSRTVPDVCSVITGKSRTNYHAMAASVRLYYHSAGLRRVRCG